jgi:hypothetical protein
MPTPLLSLFTLASAVFQPLEANLPDLNSTAPPIVEVVIQVEQTHLRAWNSSNHAELLFFSMPDGGPAAVVVLAPGSFLDGDFPRGALHGVRLEVVSLGTPPRAGEGTFVLVPGVLRIPTPDRSAWWETDSGAYRASAGPSALPASFRRALGEAPVLTSNPTPMHVPVITPSDGSGGDDPPVREDKPLPPV